MLYLRNTNQQQSLGRDIKRGITNVCCTPTLNSVTTASLTELTIDGTFGTYLVNCKSCVGGYIQVSQNSGSTWTTINPGNCSTTNLVPQPSQSAYYRLFTSCSSVDQPFDPLTSDYSNEIFFVPYGIVNYKFVEQGGANGVFRLNQNATTLVNASSSVSGTFWEIPSASFMTASLFATEFPLTGSTSMSLTVTGSGESFTTSSCLQSGAIFLDSWKVTPHLFYDVTASISHRPENSCTASNYVDMGYLVNSYDQSTGIWYHANEYGVPDTTGTYPSASITGSAVKTNVLTGDCRQNAIQFSGSLTINFGTGSFASAYIAIVTGSFQIGALTVRYENTGSLSVYNYAVNDITTKNALVGYALGTYVSPFGRKDVSVNVSGSQIANNPPSVAGAPPNFGNILTLTGEGIIRGFGYGTAGSVALQSQYNCIYETTPSK
tara:strand:- start:805 stop:2109 length:1305 start_codon:yes stop_codon:yes gene_type:complete